MEKKYKVTALNNKMYSVYTGTFKDYKKALKKFNERKESYLDCHIILSESINSHLEASGRKNGRYYVSGSTTKMVYSWKEIKEYRKR